MKHKTFEPTYATVLEDIKEYFDHCPWIFGACSFDGLVGNGKVGLQEIINPNKNRGEHDHTRLHYITLVIYPETKINFNLLNRDIVDLMFFFHFELMSSDMQVEEGALQIAWRFAEFPNTVVLKQRYV